jgi:hypothetical protein
MGIIFGTYDTIAVAGPIMVWWERRLESANKLSASSPQKSGINKAGRGAPERAGGSVGKPSRAA